MLTPSVADADADAAIVDLDADATASGLAYATLTKYFTLQATGTITVSIVPAGASSCSNALAQGTVTLDPGKLSTVVLFGDAVEADAGRSVIAFTDDRETKSDRARVRMIHAASTGPVTAAVVGATTATLAERIEPRRASATSKTIPVDALGFATIPPVAPPASVVVDRWKSKPVDLDLRGDSLHTGFVLGGVDGGFEVLWCADKSTTAELTACALLR